MIEVGSTREIFTELYEQYMPKVFQYIRYKVNSMQIAEDRTSATFEKALVNIDRFSSEKAQFSTWVFTIARNVVIDYYRVEYKKKTTSLDEIAETDSGDITPEEELSRKEELNKLYNSISHLPRDEQEIIRLKFGAELNNRQIAKMLGLSESNIGTKLYRAVKKLK